MITRVPVFRSVSVAAFGHELPLVLARVPAGFPSPAEHYSEESLDIGRYLVKRPKTTFFMRVEGDSMINAGIHPGDLLVIDQAVTAYDKSIVVARIGEDFCVKELRFIKGKCWLFSANPDYPPIEITEGDDAEIWGIATDRFRKEEPQYSPSTTLNVAPKSDSTLEMTALAIKGLEKIFRAGFKIRKAGVTLNALDLADRTTRRLWDDAGYENHRRLMQAMDSINQKYGRDTMRCGLYPSSGIWETRFAMKSPAYTTKWADVCRVGAG
jgi:DNA polymerase V